MLPFRLLCSFAVLWIAGPAVAAADPLVRITGLTPLTPAAAQHRRVEFAVMVEAAFANGHRAREVTLDLVLTAPSGATVRVPGYVEDPVRAPHSSWRLRFAPAEAGVYRGHVELRTPAGADRRPVPDFAVAATADRGFLRRHDDWTFRFDNGEPWRGVGINFGWESRSEDDSRYFRGLHQHPRFNYETMLGGLRRHRADFVRTWMCAWNLPLEWRQVIHTDRYTPDAAYFNPSAIRRLDELIALAEQLDVRLMLTLDHAGCYVGGQWELNNYHVRNGGPAATPLEFFTSPEARERYRDRLRYLVARWGYSPHLAVWEFFNEIDNVIYGQPVPIPDAVVTAWHREMAGYLRALDPQRRLISTSISHRDVAGLNEIPAIDFNQRHVYGPSAGFAELLRSSAAAWDKPYVIGEFSFEWDWSKNFEAFAGAMDSEFRRGLWRGLFAPTPILPLTWWWEYFESRGQFVHLTRVRSVLDRMLAAGAGEFRPAAVTLADPAVEHQAVRCGGTVFVWLCNPTDAARTAAWDGHAGPAELYDPVADTWSTLPAANPRSIPLPPGGERVLVLQPAPAAP